MLDHHINDGALTPRQGHEKDIYLFIYLFNKDWGFFK